ncbi:hypothetical protein SRABI121_01649 [Microbacterium sp. Bi121]|nr:hypothetical protein SRABI121_01649 [Microbacterium sp. Bi121]
MTESGQRNDWIRTGPALPGAVLHFVLPLTAAIAAVQLLPVLWWQVAMVGFAVLGMLVPQTLAGWLSIACLAIGMLLTEPGVWQTMLAVLVVHVIHVLSSLLPLVPWRGPVVLAALLPTLRRLLVVQLIAQPLTFAVMLVQTSGGATIGWSVLVGAACVAGFAVLFLLRAKRRSDRA